MGKLKCDICGGILMMQSGGKTAVCDSCGMQYSVERIREKVQEIRGTVRVEGPVQARQTGTEDDVSQWRSLLDKYYSAGDFQAAEHIVKKILEAVPSDEQANKMYDELQVLKFMEIKNGVLLSYSGQADCITIPSCVHKISELAFRRSCIIKSITIPSSIKYIGDSIFKNCESLESITLPDSIVEIGAEAFLGCSALRSIIIPKGIVEISNGTFEGCSSLSSILIPNSVKEIGQSAFDGCSALRSIMIPESVKKIGQYAFYGCSALQSIMIPESVEEIEGSAFYKCSHLNTVSIPQRFISDDIFYEYYGEQSPWYANELKKQNRCQHCGGKFTGIFTQKCVRCGKPKDY